MNASHCCPSKAFCKEKVSTLEFAQLVRDYRGITIRQPHSKETSIAPFLIGPFSHQYLSFGFETRQGMEKLIKNQGVLKIAGHVHMLFIAHHESQKDIYPCGAILVTVPKVQSEGENDQGLLVTFLSVREDFQGKYFCTLLMSYAVKLAQERNLNSVRLYTSIEGIYPYVQFGFASEEASLENWKKQSLEGRVRFIKSELENKKLILRFNRSDVRVAMREQLFRALIDFNNINNCKKTK